MRGRQIIRQWSLLLHLAEWCRGVTLENLAATARVSSRTVRRDLEELSEAGFQVIYDRDAGGAFYKLLNPAVVDALKLARNASTAPGLRRQFEEAEAVDLPLQQQRHREV